MAAAAAASGGGGGGGEEGSDRLPASLWVALNSRLPEELLCGSVCLSQVECWGDSLSLVVSLQCETVTMSQGAALFCGIMGKYSFEERGGSSTLGVYLIYLFIFT